MYRTLPVYPHALTALALIAAGCGPQAPGTVTDDLGRSVDIQTVPDKVLTLAPGMTELVATAAGVERLAGAAESDNFPASVRALPRFQSFPLNTERVVELAPSIIFGSADINTAAQADALTGLGIPTYLFSFNEVADIPRALLTLDSLLATTGGAVAAADFELRVDAVAEAVSSFAPVRTLLLVGDETLYAFGRDSYASEVVRLAGGENLTDRYDGAAAQPSEEAVLDMAPQVIIILAGDNYDTSDLVTKHPSFLTVPAVLNGRVYSINPDLLSRPGPRVVDALERLARLLHPEAFAAGAA